MSAIFFSFHLSKTVSRLKAFWKEAPFLRLQPFDDDDEDSALNDIFGIEFKSKLNRAKFMFDSTVCQLFLLTSLALSLALNAANGNKSTLLQFVLPFSDELGSNSFNRYW